MAHVPHLRVSMRGVFGTAGAPVEIWSWGFQLGRGAGGAPGEAPLQGLAAGIATEYVQHIAAITNTFTVLTSVRVADVATTGRIQRRGDGAYNQVYHFQDVPGTASVAIHAPQVALVVSLNTELEDLCGRGRFFLPGPAEALGADFKIGPGQTADIATRVRLFLEQVSERSDQQGFGRVRLASQGSVARGIPAALRPITSVGVGRVLDTMRSRRNALDETPVIQVTGPAMA